jgi:hypothetical protein
MANSKAATGVLSPSLFATRQPPLGLLQNGFQVEVGVNLR